MTNADLCPSKGDREKEGCNRHLCDTLACEEHLFDALKLPLPESCEVCEAHIHSKRFHRFIKAKLGGDICKMTLFSEYKGRVCKE